jgi:hypothetical protein
MQLRRFTRLTNAFSKKGFALESGDCAPLRALQFLPCSFELARDSVHVCWNHGSHLEHSGTDWMNLLRH